MESSYYKPVKRVHLSDEVSTKIQKLIAEGSLKAGERLPSVRNLAQMFGVSVAVIREVVVALEATGIVKVQQGIGVTITDWALNEIQGLTMRSLINESHTVQTVLEARKLIEPHMARLSAERATDDDITNLTRVHEELLQEINAGRSAAEQDFQFHLLVAQASKNVVIETMFSTISGLYRYTQKLHRVKTWDIPNRPQVVAKEHGLILKAISSHDPQGAEQAVLEHIVSVERTLFPLT